MNEMKVDCEACGLGDICKIPENKRGDCKMHNEIEMQYWKKTRVIGGLSMNDIRKTR